MRPTLPAGAARAIAELEGRPCLVTGGLGFIGSNLALALLDAGAHVTVIDSLEPRHGGDRRNLEGTEAEIVVADIADAGAVRDPLARAEVVFNLAGQVSHIDSMEDPLRDLDLNARSQLGFLELLRGLPRPPRLVYASTRQIYGRPQADAVAEDHPVEPVDVNGVSKFAADRFHLLYHHVHGIPATVLRLSNVYGPRQRLDGDHQGFLPVFFRQAIGGETIRIYGDGSQRRDCLYVDDAVAAMVVAATREAAVGEAFNIGHHESHSLLEIAHLAIATAGRGDVENVPWPAERRRIAIDSYRTDYAKARHLLGWAPTVSLQDGLRATLEFMGAQAAAGGRV